MAKSKRKCTGCKKHYPVEEIEIDRGVVAFHTVECYVEYRRREQEKARLKQISKLYLNKGKAKRKTKEEIENDIKSMRRLAKEACHEYIRERDRGKPCICCGQPLGDDYDAGHYKKSGNHAYTRYDEDNIFGQRRDCNRHKGGNESGMRKGIIERIGEERLNRIEQVYSEPIRWTCEDLVRIRDYYKEKLKALKSERNQL